MSRNRFNGKVAVITGGASGIGLAIARLLVAEGGQVMLADMNEAAGAAAVAELGSAKAAFQRCDVARFDEVQALIQRAVAVYGGLDLLFNNAGIGGEMVKVPDVSLESWHRVIAVDLDAVFYGCKVAIPEMRKRGGGAIVNTASISGLGGDFGFNSYNAAKAAVINFTRTMAIDHADENIRVNALAPGFIDTPLTSMAGDLGIRDEWLATVPMQRAGKPEEMANAAAFLASDEASYVTGTTLVADGGVTAMTGQPNLFKKVQALMAAQPQQQGG